MSVNNIKKITVREAKDYLYFINNILVEMLWKRAVFIDFITALDKQKTQRNVFTTWAIQNYYSDLVLNLCKLLEPKKDNKNECTLRHFINTIKDKKHGNYQMMEEKMMSETIVITNITDGSKKIDNIGGIMLHQFHNIDLDKDLECIQTIHSKLKDYRDKKLCHNDKQELDESTLPNIEELHTYIDEIKDIFIKYFHVFFRQGIDYSDLERNKYGKFHLFLE